MTVQTPLPVRTAFAAVLRCCGTTVRMLLRRRIHQPENHLGMRLHFADGTSAVVYRETVIERQPATEPCALIVCFRLRAVRGRAHAAFRWESLLNTPLFAGFSGLVSKLWLANDERGVYRGVYQWDGPASAAAYARSLWRVLELVSVRGSIHYQVLPGVLVDDLLSHPPGTGPDAWWRVVGADARSPSFGR
ncbi:MAG TPA: hypothetical protein VFT31_04730 [Kribbella sp.]|nr:hypothetical protein [Kribbella sp.]